MVHISTPLSTTKHTNAHIQTHFLQTELTTSIQCFQFSLAIFCITTALRMQKFSNGLVYYFRTTSTFNHTKISNGKHAQALLPIQTNTKDAIFW